LSPDERDERDSDAAELTGAGRASGAAGDGGGPPGPGAGPALDTARALLARRTRELVEAVVLSEAAAAELGVAAAEIGSLAARLGAQRRPLTSAVDPAGGPRRRPRTPVTSEANPLAPPIRITTAPQGTARAEFTLGPVYEGPPGAVHGGVCAAILDSLLGAAAAAGHRPGMTAKLTLSYLRPTPLGVPLVAEAWITGVDRRITLVEGRILNDRGELTVEATGEFSLPLHWQHHAQPATRPAGDQPG
jgi:uncharacterized protein (TIGR00369 family)